MMRTQIFIPALISTAVILLWGSLPLHLSAGRTISRTYTSGFVPPVQGERTLQSSPETRIDARRPVSDTAKFPFSAVCKIRVRFPDGTSVYGTGTVVGLRHVLTSAHLVYSPKQGGWAVPDSIEIIPGYENGRAPFGIFHVAKNVGESKVGILAFAGWVQEQKDSDDCAMLITEGEIGRRTGWFGVGWCADKELDHATVHMAGYPSDRDAGERQYYAAGSITRTTPSLVFYQIATANGQSGSGVFRRILADREDDEPQRYIFAIHHGGNTVENSATRLTLSHFARVRRWLAGVYD